MSDKDEAKVNESKDSSGSKRSHKKNDGITDAKSSSSSTASGNNNGKGNKIQKTEPSHSSTSSTTTKPSFSPSPTSSTTTKPSSSPSSTSSTTTKPSSSPSPSTQTTAEKPPSVTTSVTNTATNTQTEIDSANSHTVQKSNVINPVPEYNNLNRESLSVPEITSNYFCFDCGAIMTTIEDKEQHMKIESERKNNPELIAEE